MYTDSGEHNPQTETETREVSETLPDGSVVKKTVTTTNSRQVRIDDGLMAVSLCFLYVMFSAQIRYWFFVVAVVLFLLGQSDVVNVNLV